MEIGDIFIYIYMVRETHFSSTIPGLHNVGGVSVNHFQNVITTGNEH